LVANDFANLIFDLPSRVKQLGLPLSEFGSLCIPDSVKFFYGNLGKRDGQYRLLQFDPESCVMKHRLGTLVDFRSMSLNADIRRAASIDFANMRTIAKILMPV
jgi:hypothetical protein